MDENGIGTDASIPMHIANIIERRYVDVVDQDGRLLPKEDAEGVGAGGGRGGGRGGAQGQKGGGRKVGQVSGGICSGGGGRHLKPTELGLALIQGFRAVDEGLVKPEIRAAMEYQVSLIAKGEADKARVLDLNLALYYSRFRFSSLCTCLSRLKPA
jgi:DNA topoisomerase IA